MRDIQSDDIDERILIFDPSGEEAERSLSLLRQEGFDCIACPTLAHLANEMEAGIGALVLTAPAALAAESLEPLQAALDRQPPWSHPPLVLLSGDEEPPLRVLERLSPVGSLFTLQRPVAAEALASAIRAALRARRRQYEVRDLLASLETNCRQKDEFLDVLAHELRDPLAPLTNAVQLLRMRAAADPAADRIREIVERQVQHMCRLVDDLLDLSRLTQGRLTLRVTRLDLAVVAQMALEDHQTALDAAGLTTRLELPEEPVWVEGDSTHLAQVLGSLLRNALQLSDPGGQVTLRVGVEHLAPDQPGTAFVTVQDTGVGISPETLPRVFEPFARAESDRDRRPGGLDMVLVKRLVELHGGSVSAASSGPSQGSEFTVRLPLAATASPDQ